MRRLLDGLLIGFLVGCLGVTFGEAASSCAPDAVEVGPICVDKYEESVWSIPPEQEKLIKKVKKGKVALADLTAGGAVQISPSKSCSPAFPGSFPVTGNWTTPLYAVSIPGVPPTACISWFQAEQACALSGKRLLNNQEWQRAAAGTPVPEVAGDLTTSCAITSGGPVTTGSRSACVSRWGVFDMVGNVWEWVADWVPLSTGCAPDLFGTSDANCLAGASTTAGPGALIRGSDWGRGPHAGVFAINGGSDPSSQFNNFGFRCAR